MTVDRTNPKEVSSVLIDKPSRMSPREYRDNPKRFKTGRIGCEVGGDTGHGDATHLFTPEGSRDEFALCGEHMQTVVKNAIKNDKNIKQRPLRAGDVLAHKKRRANQVEEVRTASIDLFKAKGLSGEDSWAGKRPTGGRPANGTTRGGISFSGNHTTPNPGAPDPKVNKENNPERYDEKGRIYNLNAKGKIKAIADPKFDLETSRAEAKAARSASAKAANNPGRFAKGSNKNPGFAKVSRIEPSTASITVPILEKISKENVESYSKEDAANKEGARLRNIEALKNAASVSRSAAFDVGKTL